MVALVAGSKGRRLRGDFGGVAMATLFVRNLVDTTVWRAAHHGVLEQQPHQSSAQSPRW
jgi:hypothetical protein